jgi:hypothetical protein
MTESTTIVVLEKSYSPGLVAAGAAVLKENLELLLSCENPEQAMRGFLFGAAKDGFKVSPYPGASRQELYELCIRAHWWNFERILASKAVTQ